MADLSDLKSFLTILEHGSINSAARALYISPSTASRRLSSLEREYGVRLFDRGEDGLRATRAGETMAEHARRILLDDQVMRASVSGAAQTWRELRVATTMGLAQRIVAPAAREFAQEGDAVPVSVEMAKSSAIPVLISGGEADVAATFSTAPHRGCRVEWSARTRNVAIMDAEHPMAGRDHVTVADLLDYPVAMLSPGNTARVVLERAFVRSGRPFRPAFECDCPTATAQFIRGSESVAMISELLVDGAGGGQRSGDQPGDDQSGGGQGSSAVNGLRSGLATVPVVDPAVQDREVQVLVPSERLRHEATAAFVACLVQQLSG